MTEEIICPRTWTDGGDEKSDWGGNIHHDYSPIHEFLDSVEREDFFFSEQSAGVFKITYKGKSFFYWPKSDKWRAEGKSKIYRARDIRQFLNKYVFREE